MQDAMLKREGYIPMKKLIRFLGVMMLIIAVSLPCMSAMAEDESGYVLATGDVNVRTGPGLGYDSLGVLKKGKTLEYLNETSTDNRGVIWYKVQFDSWNAGWVSDKYATISGAANYGYVKATGGQSNLRTGPGLNYDDIGTLKAGQTATYLGTSSTDSRGVVWYQVNYNGKTCWVSSKYTTLVSGENTGSASYSYVRATGQVNVRSGPGAGYDNLGTMEKNEQVVYLGQSAKDGNGVTWYKIRYYSFGEAWVSSAHSKIVSDAAFSEGVADESAKVTGSYVKATGGKSTLRSGPGLGYKDLDTVQKGETATYLGSYSKDERGETWYKVRFEGKEGWISSRYTTLY